VFALSKHGLLQVRWNSDGGGQFTIAQEGFDYYEHLRGRPSDPADAIEEEVRRYLDTKFAGRFPEARDRLRAAEEMLWKAKPEDDFTTIGHKLREAIQQFATKMLELHPVEGADPDAAKTKNRLAGVISVNRARLGDRKAAVLSALLEYHDAVNGLVQRQEHGDQKPGDPLTWEDARTTVFQTVYLMFEFDRVLNG
jgi:hypothetical protein